MNIEWIAFFSFAFLFLAFIMIRAMLDEAKKKKIFKKKLYEEYGKRRIREYPYHEYENLTHYFKRKENLSSEQVIDDITWNDLGMDNIFMLLNHTWSQAGDEYLYDCLRRPQKDISILEERERLISYFSEHKDERVQMQLLFASMGRTKKISISDYLYYLDQLDEGNNMIHYCCDIVGLIAMALIFLNPPVGFVTFICALVFNLATYFKYKGKIDAYITTFNYMMKLMGEADKIAETKIDTISEYTSELKQILNSTKGFRRNSFILASTSTMTGNIMEIPLDYLRMFFHLDLIKFNSMLHVVKQKKKELERMVEIIGFLDSMIAIGEFRAYLPYYCIPEFQNDSKAYLDMKELYHPILENPVASSITAQKGILVTGSNASGKSTFLKSVAISAILAQTIHTVAARSYRGSFFRIASSMALSDNLLSGESYYMVEIKSLKRILDMADKKEPLLCFIDEVLRGTNTIERIAASAQILKSLQDEHIICFAATHDVELTYMLETYFDNYHFTEEFEGNDIRFPYQIIKGRAESRNAIRLLNVIGYDDKITKAAEASCEKFLKAGNWEKL